MTLIRLQNGASDRQDQMITQAISTHLIIISFESSQSKNGTNSHVISVARYFKKFILHIH